MKVQNLKARQMHISFPIGATSLRAKSRSVAVEPGEYFELSDEDGKKLIELDRQLHLPAEKRTKTDPACWCWGLEGEQFSSSQGFVPCGDAQAVSSPEASAPTVHPDEAQTQAIERPVTEEADEEVEDEDAKEETKTGLFGKKSKKNKKKGR